MNYAGATMSSVCSVYVWHWLTIWTAVAACGAVVAAVAASMALRHGLRLVEATSEQVSVAQRQVGVTQKQMEVAQKQVQTAQDQVEATHMPVLVLLPLGPAGLRMVNAGHGVALMALVNILGEERPIGMLSAGKKEELGASDARNGRWVSAAVAGGRHDFAIMFLSASGRLYRAVGLIEGDTVVNLPPIPLDDKGSIDDFVRSWRSAMNIELDPPPTPPDAADTA